MELQERRAPYQSTNQLCQMGNVKTKISKPDEGRNKTAKVIDAVDIEGYNLLHFAARDKDAILLKVLVQYTSNINVRDHGNDTALHIVLKPYPYNREVPYPIDYVNLVRILVSKGADVNARNAEGKTPLHLAIEFGLLDAAQVLLEYSVDVNICDDVGNSVLHYLSRVKVNSLETEELLNSFLNLGCDINAMNYSGETPLSVAVYGKNEKYAVCLVERGAEFRGKEDCYVGTTVLHLATEFRLEELLECMVRIADTWDPCKLDAFINAKQATDSSTALHLATLHRDNQNILQTLLQHGADVEMCNKNGQTPLHLASFYENVKAFTTLIDFGGNIQVLDKKGNSPLSFAENLSIGIWWIVIRINLKLIAAGQKVLDYQPLLSNLVHNMPSALKYNQEIIDMKETSIGSGDNLFDLMVCQEKMQKHRNNAALKKIMNEGMLNNKFQSYQELLLPVYKKAVMREKLVNMCRNHLREMIGFAINDSSYDLIIKYLSNDDLHELIRDSIEH